MKRYEYASEGVERLFTYLRSKRTPLVAEYLCAYLVFHFLLLCAILGPIIDEVRSFDGEWFLGCLKSGIEKLAERCVQIHFTFRNATIRRINLLVKLVQSMYQFIKEKANQCFEKKIHGITTNSGKETEEIVEYSSSLDEDSLRDLDDYVAGDISVVQESVA